MTPKLPSLFLLAALAFGATACTSLQSVSVNSVPTDRTRPVEASEDNTALFGIHFDNDFVNELPARLRNQCRGGKVTGIFTKQESYWYVIVGRRKVTVKGYCTIPEREPEVAARVLPPPPEPGENKSSELRVEGKAP